MAHIGIDLGTTFSCVIHHNKEGKDEVVSSAEGGDLTPSVVYFDPDGSVLVGETAKRLLRTDPENVVVGIKRHMGLPSRIPWYKVHPGGNIGSHSQTPCD